MLRPSPEQPCKPRWGVVQLVGHLTVNEDGEGSNPSAPANFPCKTAVKIASGGLIPIPPSEKLVFPNDISEPRRRGAPAERRHGTRCGSRWRIFPWISNLSLDARCRARAQTGRETAAGAVSSPEQAHEENTQKSRRSPLHAQSKWFADTCFGRQEHCAGGRSCRRRKDPRP